VAEPEEKLEQLSKAYKAVFSGDNGKLVLEDLKGRGFYNIPTWAGNAEQTLINEGARQLVLHIITMVEFDLADLQKMFKGQPEEEF
jgi:hypothetical protein